MGAGMSMKDWLSRQLRDAERGKQPLPHHTEIYTSLIQNVCLARITHSRSYYPLHAPSHRSQVLGITPKADVRLDRGHSTKIRLNESRLKSQIQDFGEVDARP